MLRLGIGGITLGILYDGRTTDVEVEDVYKGFIVDDAPDVVLQLYRDHVPDLGRRELVFDSGGRWCLHRTSNGRLIFSYRLPHLDFTTRQVIVLEPDFRSGCIYLGNASWPLQLARDLLPAPLGEILLVNILSQSQGSGLMLHAYGIIDQGRGILFAGTSGAGKSTLAKLWERRKDVTVLSDDRVVVRKQGDRFWLYGTPWYGEVKAYSSQRAPLERIFVLKHAAQNNCTKLHRVGATRSLLVRSFSTFWDKSGMEYALQFCAELGKAIPCYELSFVPDESIIEFVRNASDEL